MQPIYTMSDREAHVFAGVFAGTPIASFVMAAVLCGCAEVDRNGDPIKTWRDTPHNLQSVVNHNMQKQVKEQPRLLMLYERVWEDGHISWSEEEKFSQEYERLKADAFILEQIRDRRD